MPVFGLRRCKPDIATRDQPGNRLGSEDHPEVADSSRSAGVLCVAVPQKDGRWLSAPTFKKPRFQSLAAVAGNLAEQSGHARPNQ